MLTRLGAVHKWPAVLALIAGCLPLTPFKVEPFDETPFGTFHMWDVPLAFGITVACGVGAAVLALPRLRVSATARAWACVALAAALIVAMSLVGPGLLVFGEQFITVCDNHGCVVDREFPGARVVSQDERLASAIHRSEHDARLVAPDLWPAATWLLVIGSAVWIYRLSGRWSDLVAAATAPVGTAMPAASLSPDGNFLLEAVAGLAMVVVVLELLAALTLALRQRWLYLACLIVVGRSDRTHTRFDVSRPHLMWGDRCQQPATNPQCQGSHE